MDYSIKSIKAKSLQINDTIGIISPSSPAAGLFPYRFNRALDQLNQLTYKTILGHTTTDIFGYLSGTPENRSKDIYNMFINKEVKAIICSIGGDHSCQLLNLIDYTAIQNNPKIIMGYSDITVLLISIWKTTGLITFYGPTLMTEFAEYPSIPDYSLENSITLLSNKHKMIIEPSPYYINEFIPWGSDLDYCREKERIPGSGWRTIIKGTGNGYLIGGCIESLQHLRGTNFWPDFKNAILFLETSSTEPNIQFLDGVLSDYENMGIFEQINGLVFGRKNWEQKYQNQLFKLLYSKLKKKNIPSMMNLDFGHISPIITLPIGCWAFIDSKNKVLKLNESPVEDIL